MSTGFATVVAVEVLGIEALVDITTNDHRPTILHILGLPTMLLLEEDPAMIVLVLTCSQLHVA